MKEYQCHFVFDTVVQTHGRDGEGAIENVEKVLNDELIQGAERIMCCGVDFDRDNIETKEVENGWFELVLHWSGSWSIDAQNKTKAKEQAEKFLNEMLTPFYQMLENEADKRRRFEFWSLKNEKVTDILIY